MTITTVRSGTVVAQGERPAARRRRLSRGRTRSAWLFLAPFWVLFLATFIAPICYAVEQSLFALHRDGLGLTAPTTRFVALDNYVRAVQDSEFLSSLVRVVGLGVVQVPLMLGLSLLLALLLDSASVRWPGVFRTLFFLPYALPGVIAAIMWSYLYQPGISPLAKAAGQLGLDIDFTAPAMTLPDIGNMVTWGWTGYNMLIIFAALKAVPAELFEAAALDGCSGWRIAWHIKIPNVRGALILTTVFSIIGMVQLYAEPDILRGITNTITSDYTPILAAQKASDAGNYQYAAAQSVVLALLTLVLSFTFLKFTQRKGAGE
ncbi:MULTISPECIES: carbohydrate ABC transporter permease [unclassified Streptomyces]|uniref:carbohydrate ABC transporter permease n=1 Tax=unclassified Streptomyces TaxID=2593676 RepID=UPI002DDAFE12|nr:sugar ABC transporter permease [Streptomyces sp. NBC_01445]WSE11294.1 sugar ABC transporter permease [Streptomyces sp. NBC_01445]